MHMAKSPVKLSDVELEDLAHSIKMESQIVDCDPLSDHDSYESECCPLSD